MNLLRVTTKLFSSISFIRRLYRSRLRTRMRGYRYLQRDGKQPLIYDINGALRACKLVIPNEQCSKAIFGAAFKNAELVVRQRLASREGSVIRLLLFAAGQKESRVSLPLPSEWLQEVESFGFLTNRFESFLYLYSKALKDLFLGSIQIIINLKNNFAFLKRSILPVEDFIYFCDLVHSNLPQPVGNKHSYCVINWYLKWQGTPKDLHVIAHGVAGYSGSHIGDTRLIYRKSPLPDLVGALSFMRYVFWAIKAISISAYDLLFGRWWHAMLLREASFAALVRYGDKRMLARQYFFHNSRYHEPLWTYELKAHGSEAIVYWYSTNTQPWQRADGSRPFITPYSLMNWHHHLVWNEAQENFVRSCGKANATVEIVGPIWFQDSANQVHDVPKELKIVVFDVQPFRTSRYFMLAPFLEYYIPKVVNQFLLDIVNTAITLKAVVISKRKREIGKIAHPSYRRFVDQISLESKLTIINPDVSAFRLIEKADVVVSMPFTSTALSARHAGRPSIYYDPSFLLSSEDPAANGIPIVQGREALENWLRTELDLLRDKRCFAGMSGDGNANLNVHSFE